MGKTAVIVGASQGLGAELAILLYKEGCSVVLVARREAKLQEQVEKISLLTSKSSEATATYIASDVSKYEGAVSLWNQVFERDQDPDFVFCCAGSAVPKLLDDITPDEINTGIDTNYKTAFNTIHAMFKKVKSAHNIPYNQHKKRHVVLCSSVVAFFPFIGYGQYAPMKAALLSLSLILRHELGPYNFRVSCVFPGNFLSEGYEIEQASKPEITRTIEGPSNAILAQECAEIVLDKLSKGYDTVTTDFIGWLLGCSTLGMLPRSWGLFQVILSFFLLIIAPIANIVIYNDITKYFKERENKKKK